MFSLWGKVKAGLRLRGFTILKTGKASLWYCHLFNNLMCIPPGKVETFRYMKDCKNLNLASFHEQAVTKEDLVAGNYTVDDVVLPLPG